MTSISSIKSSAAYNRHVGNHRSRTQCSQATSVKPGLTQYVFILSNSTCGLTRRHISLVLEIDSHIHSKSEVVSLRTVAAQDQVFLQHNFDFIAAKKDIRSLRCLFDLSTVLLHKIQDPFLSCAREATAKDVFSPDPLCEDLKCETFVANLEHLLQCLQQIALNAILQHYLELVESHILHWHQYWQHQKRALHEWFNEWPNGQRPLSTTWPWNVKPSLLVLWGVCWMFYGNEGRSTRNPPQANLNPSGQDFYSRSGQQSQEISERRKANTIRRILNNLLTFSSDATVAWAGPASYPNFSWLHPQQAGVAPWRASERESHEII